MDAQVREFIRRTAVNLEALTIQYTCQQVLLRALVETHPDLRALIAAHGRGMDWQLDDYRSKGIPAPETMLMMAALQREHEVLLRGLNAREAPG